MSLPASVKEIYGFPADWFEGCRYLDAEAYIYRGQVYIDGMGGPGTTFVRMKDEYRNRAGEGWER